MYLHAFHLTIGYSADHEENMFSLLDFARVLFFHWQSDDRENRMVFRSAMEPFGESLLVFLHTKLRCVHYIQALRIRKSNVNAVFA